MKRIIFMFILFCVFFSCEETFVTSESEVEATEVDLSNKNWDEMVELVAEDVSIKMNSLAFRKMLKHEVMLQFDGDYNILISSMMQRMPKYLDYEAAQSQVMSGNNADLLANYDWDVLAQAGEDYPMMQIAVQVDAENWDADNEVLSVVYVPGDFDEQTHDFVDGFDKDQNPITVSTLEDPEENYVVISQNERTYEENEMVYFSNTRVMVPCCVESAPYDPYTAVYQPIDELCVDCIDDPDPTPPSGGGGDPQLPPQYVGTGHNGTLPTLIATHDAVLTDSTDDYQPNGLIDPIGDINGVPFYRGDYKYERVRSYNIGQIGQIERFVNGAPEIYVVEFVPDRNDPTKMLQILQARHEPEKREDIIDQWWNCPLDEIHLWEWSSTGVTVDIGMYEYDRPLIGHRTQKVTLSPGSTTIVDSYTVNSDNTYTITNSETYTTPSRFLEMKSRKSEYIGIEAISVYNNQDEFRHSRGDVNYISSPDVQ